MKNIKLKYLFRHYSIYGATLFTALSIIISYISAFFWSIEVTGNAGNTGYLFGLINIKTVPIIFLTLLLMVITLIILPFYIGYKSAKNLNLEKNKKTYFFMFMAMLIIIGFYFLAFRFFSTHNAVNNSYVAVFSSGFLFAFFMVYALLVRLTDVKKFCFYSLIGLSIGDLFVFFIIPTLTLIDLQFKSINVFLFFLVPLLVLFSGIIYGISEIKLFNLLVAIILLIFYFIIIQNYIVILNNGILKTPIALERAISSESSNICEKIIVINKKNYTLFSCVGDKYRTMGEIFYQLNANDVNGMIARHEKLVTRAYCIKTNIYTKNKKNLRCVYGFIPSINIQHEPTSVGSMVINKVQ